jgi:hypothetical protein
MQNLYTRLLPFIFLGIAIVAFIFGLLLLAYLFIFGALVGLGLFAIAYIKQRFFASKEIIIPKKNQGQTIDHDE